MYRRPSKKKELIKRTAVYTVMTCLVLIVVTGLILVLLGYRFDSNNGRVEQGALLQFATTPSGATVEIDDKTLSTKTPTKSSVIVGGHQFVMWRDGYETWRKGLNIKAGTLTWLDYVRLIPKVKTVIGVAQYPALHASLATSDGQDMLLQQDAALPSFQLVNLRSDDIKTTIVAIPDTAYSDATTAGITHNFRIDSWDEDGRYVLIQHTYGPKTEWLVLDTRDVSKTVNVTTLLDLDITSPKFSGTSGNILYALTGGDIRKLDLSAGTISRSLVTGVTSFELFETNVVTYVGTSQTDPTKRVVGLYREGDSVSHVLRTVTSSADIPLHIATASYFNQDYVAIAEGNKIDIVSGSYPASDEENSSTLRKFATFTFAANVDRLLFSPAGDYLLVQSGTHFSSYDIEHKRIGSSTITTDPGAVVAPLQWLDDNYLWSDYGGNAILREFDGTNGGVINPVAPGQDVTLSQSGRYLYSIGKTDTGYQLQRVRMILP